MRHYNDSLSHKPTTIHNAEMPSSDAERLLATHRRRELAPAMMVPKPARDRGKHDTGALEGYVVF